jgi:hypothetical protein
MYPIQTAEARVLKGIVAIAVALALAVFVSGVASAKQRDRVTHGSWGKGVAVIDPTVIRDGTAVTNYAAIDLRVTLSKAYGPIVVAWDDGANNVIGACGGCVPQVLTPGVYTFQYTPGPSDPPGSPGWTPPPYKVAEARIGHFNLSWTDAKGHPQSLQVPVQTDTGFLNLPLWARSGL